MVLSKWTFAGMIPFMTDLPPAGATGSYALVFRLETPLEIQAGRLGRVLLPKGLLVYAGSALGPGGLRARIARHFRPTKRIHWHIDALSTLVRPVACYCDLSGSRLECRWAQLLAGLPEARIPVAGFGSSDCGAGCPAHLIHFPYNAHLDLGRSLACASKDLIYLSTANS